MRAPDASGFEIAVERGAGAAAGSPTTRTRRPARRLVERRPAAPAAAAVVRVAPPSADEVAARSRAGTVLIGFLAPLADPEGIERLRAQGVVAFAMESIPRITRAQSMDALSSQATVAGYKAVLLAADRVPKMFPLLMTAAGTIAPARALVLGAGVAGLQAIATARRLGAVVSAFDVRPAVRGAGGVARRDVPRPRRHAARRPRAATRRSSRAEQQAAQQAALERAIPDFDVVITTALVPGPAGPAPDPRGVGGAHAARAR